MTAKEWDNYWGDKKKNRIFKIFRTHVFARAVRYYTDKYFSREGVFVEAGCGSGQTSIRIVKYNRKLIALDISKKALEEARKNTKFDEFIEGDIANLPFEDNSIDGIWNLGVMEHFSHSDLIIILHEFRRVLKDNGTLVGNNFIVKKYQGKNKESINSHEWSEDCKKHGILTWNELIRVVVRGINEKEEVYLYRV